MLLQHLVEDFIVDHQWQIPSSLQAGFPNLLPYLNNVAILIVEKEDQRVWKYSSSGHL
jgi:hypothetical protein